VGSKIKKKKDEFKKKQQTKCESYRLRVELEILGCGLILTSLVRNIFRAECTNPVIKLYKISVKNKVTKHELRIYLG